MKTKSLKSFLMLVASIMVLASCERELIYLLDPFSEEVTEGYGNSEMRSRDIHQPALTPPANPGVIKAGDAKSAGNITLANGSRQYLRIVNLGFTFTGAGAQAVDSISFTIRGFAQVKVKVVDNKFAIDGIRVPANTFTDIMLIYKLDDIVPSGIEEGAQITLSLTSFSTDEAMVTLPNSGRYPNPINLDKISLDSDDDGNGDDDDGDDDDGDGDDDGDDDENGELKASTWLSEPNLSYANPFAITGNSLSSEMSFTINSTSAKTLKSLVASFGENGKAVKMLRYSLNGGDWKIIKAVNGKINFENLSLKSGENSFKAYFSLLPNTDVSNGSALSFSFVSLDDGEGGTTFSSGKFPDALNVGSVHTSVSATVIKAGWFSYLRVPALVAAKDAEADMMIHVIQLQMTGPAPAKIVSVKFVNPYTAFNAISGNDFKFTDSWSFDLNDANRLEFKPDVSNQNTFTVNFPSKDIPCNGTYQRISIFAGVKNSGNTFDSGAYTPGKFGLKLADKYDIVIQNGLGQVIDLSDVNIWQDGVLVN